MVEPDDAGGTGAGSWSLGDLYASATEFGLNAFLTGLFVLAYMIAYSFVASALLGILDTDVGVHAVLYLLALTVGLHLLFLVPALQDTVETDGLVGARPGVLLVPAAVAAVVAWRLLAWTGVERAPLVFALIVYYAVVAQTVALYGAVVDTSPVADRWRPWVAVAAALPLTYLLFLATAAIGSGTTFGEVPIASWLDAQVSIGGVTGPLLVPAAVGTSLALCAAFVLAQFAASVRARRDGVRPAIDRDALRESSDEEPDRATDSGGGTGTGTSGGAGNGTGGGARTGTVGGGETGVGSVGADRAASGGQSLQGEWKHERAEAERAHRAAQRSEPPVARGDRIELVPLELDRVEEQARGTYERFQVFVDHDLPEDLPVGEPIRVQVTDLATNEDGDVVAAHARFLERV